MRELSSLTQRNTRMYFKDMGMFLSSLITPLILLVLHGTFLGGAFRNSFVSAMPENFAIDDALIDGLVSGQLLSSILAVSCVTVAFCSNMVMVQDKVTGALGDLTVTPVKRSTLALGYYLSTVLVTMIICVIALSAGLVYVAATGWYLTVGDILWLLLDIFLLVMFGTALSSIINFFLTTQGQISAVGTTISAGYGFLCGAYMPISSFGTGLQKVLSFLPGTYGTVLIRSHTMRGTFAEMARVGFPQEAIKGIRDGVDCNFYFFGTRVSTAAQYAVLIGAIVLLIGVYVLLNHFRKPKKK